MTKLKSVKVTQGEIQNAMKSNVHKNKKKYARKANDFSDWLDELEDKEQPKACNINNHDCENCGS